MDNKNGPPVSGQHMGHASLEWFESVWDERGLDRRLMRKLYEQIKDKLKKKIHERYEKVLTQDTQNIPAVEADEKDTRSDLCRAENIVDQQPVLAPQVMHPIRTLAARRSCKRQAIEVEPVDPKKHKIVDFIDLTGDSESDGSGRLRNKNALGLHVKMLTPFEWSEISSYSTVYYVGCLAKNKIWGVLGGPRNGGYDDDQDGYRFVLRDHVAYRYEVLHTLGKGSFGQVVKAFDHKTKQLVALKIIKNEPRYHKQAEQEVNILSRLRDLNHRQANIIRMLDHFTFRNHKCITFELAGLNLYEYVRQNQFRGMKPMIAAKIVNSVLQCLVMLHSEGIVHADLKPENIILKNSSGTEIKVIDFGSSCYVGKQTYSYIQSRYYRAPEVILGYRYCTAIDMWSLGCICFELLAGRPLLPGEDEADQLALVIELLGMPPLSYVEHSKRCETFFTAAGNPLYCCLKEKTNGSIEYDAGKSTKSGKYRGPPGSRTLESCLPNHQDPELFDFLHRCLCWLPSERMTPAQAMNHPWIRAALLPIDEYNADSY